MASVNLSFCIFFILGFALVGRMVQVVEATRELDDSPLGTVKPKLLSTCAIVLTQGECDHGMDSEKNCEIARRYNIGSAEFMRSDCVYEGAHLCICSYVC
ncbi:hypothetical protein OROHE_018833 [Orobanche hederae]